ncbi:MAG: hypothetical protein Q8P41_15060 [Pseudomonadota bacterium]|nr:hypothetical protein [Pseudomonadota bacterium]
MVALLLLLLACAPEPMPLPAEAEAALDRGAEPPLYRKLYDYAFLPKIQEREQRVRLLIWLRHMGFNRYQLGLLSELAARTERERLEVERIAGELVAEHEPQVAAVYDELWGAMLAEAPEADLAVIGDKLDAVRLREADLLDLRARSVRTVLDAQQPFLRTLTPAQEALFADATFLLRHRLDPYANPGDFRALIGTIYYAGDFGMLSKSTFNPDEDHLNIGGLWSEEPADLAGAHFPNARREVVLYMVLLEPALPAAIEAATKLRSASGAAEPGAPGATLGAGAGAVPLPPDLGAPGVPVAPGPGVAGTPAPGVPGEPTPAPPGAPGGPVPVVPPTPPPGKPTEPAPAAPGAPRPVGAAGPAAVGGG